MLYKGPSENKSDSDNDSDKDYELVIDDSIDTGSNIGEEESIEATGEVANAKERPSIGALTIARYQQRWVNICSTTLSISFEKFPKAVVTRNWAFSALVRGREGAFDREPKIGVKRLVKLSNIRLPLP